MNNTLAIDFGTSRTKAAYWDEESGKSVLWRISQTNDNPYIPSLFHLSSNGILYGDDADEMISADPGGVVEKLKRNLRASHIRKGGQKKTPHDLLVYLFQDLRQRSAGEISAFKNKAPDNVVLTIPALYGIADQETMESSALKAGFKTVVLIKEPIAAAKAFLATQGQIQNNVVVFDCGGGTVDWACLKRNGSHLDVVSECPADGDDKVGGVDIEEALIEILREELLVDDIPSAEMPSILKKLRLCKERFSRGMPLPKVVIAGKIIDCSNAMIQEAIDERFIKQAVTGLKAYLKSVENHLGHLPPVLLVGGSSRLKGLKEAIKSETNVDVLWWEESEFATVKGAVFGDEIEASSSAKGYIYDNQIDEMQYKRAVKMAWVGKVLQQEEITHLEELAKQLNLPESKQVQIEKSVIGKSVKEIVQLEINKNKEIERELIERELKELEEIYLNYLKSDLSKQWLKNKQIRWEIWKNDAAYGNPSAQCLVGDMYDEGVGVLEDKAKAMEFYGKAAKQGHPYGQVLLGTKYLSEGNYNDAISLFNKAKSSGHILASFLLGTIYFKGLGFEKNYPLAVSMFLESNGLLASQVMLGVANYNGLGVSQNYKDAVKYFLNTCNYSDVAQYYLGIAYYDGNGIKSDKKESVKWLLKAANNGNIDATAAIGVLCYDTSVSNNGYQEAVKWLFKAAELETMYLPAVQYYLGLAHLNGKGTDKSEPGAIKWFMKAAENDHASAQNQIGIFYHSGQCVNKDYKLAVKWFRASAENGFEWGQYNLGQMYRDGLGISQDKNEAKKWFSLAAEKGLEEAKEALKNMTGSEILPSIKDIFSIDGAKTVEIPSQYIPTNEQQPSKKAGKINLIYEGTWFLVDSTFVMSINGAFYSEFSVKNGFSATIDNCGEEIILTFKLKIIFGRTTTIKIPKFNIHDSYDISFKYDRAWGGMQSTPKIVRR